MNCDACESRLTDYHFGTLQGTAREELEEHLATCADCIRSFIELKRDIELSASATDSPSTAAKQRLNEAVEKALAEKRSKAPARVIAMPQKSSRAVPYFLGAAAVVFSVFFTGSLATSQGSRPHSLSDSR
jgi:anti-sigma factor RsiW